MNQPLFLENEISGIFSKFPSFPDNVKDILVKIAPFLAIIGAVLGAIGLVGALFVGGAVSIGTGAYGGSMAAFWIGIGFFAILVVLYGLAISPLFKQQKRGWDLMYYAALLATVSNIVTGLLGGSFVGTIIGAVIGFVIGFWILFQVREKYH